MENRDNVNEKEENWLAASIIESQNKLIETQKSAHKFYQIVILVLIAIIFAQSIYHDYKWSEFDTIVVDSGEGGNANYIGNDGDVNNYGEGISPQEKETEQQSETKAN